MLQLVIRKMFNNKWMMVCLLIGTILAVAMVSSIPMYTDAILQKMLTEDLENYSTENGVDAGRITISANLYAHYSGGTKEDTFDMFRTKAAQIVDDYGMELEAGNERVYIGSSIITRDATNTDTDLRNSINLDCVSHLEDHITIIDGRMYSTEIVDGVIETVMSKNAFERFGLLLNTDYYLYDSSTDITDPYIIRVVGVFIAADENDPFFTKGTGSYTKSMLMEHDLFVDTFVDGNSGLASNAEWNYVFDTEEFTIEHLDEILEVNKATAKYFSSESLSLGTSYTFVAADTLNGYATRSVTLTSTLWVIQVPLLLMLVFYLFMVSQLVVSFEANEISILKSRGASNIQVFMLYLLQSSIIGVAAFVIGPPIGLYLCKVIGASNGFMEFVNRGSLKVALNLKAYGYALAAAVVSIITTLIPAIIAGRSTIVESKRKKSGRKNIPFWKKFGLDFVLIGVGIYGLYSYNLQAAKNAVSTGGSEMLIDPLLFIMSTVFILGVGLFFLRIYPILVRLVFAVGKRSWSPVLYTSLVQVGRAQSQDQFIMLFLIMTLSIGLFNANAARTINSNTEDQIQYASGADLVIMEDWPSSATKAAATTLVGTSETESTTVITYEEPDITLFDDVEGIEAYTEVFIRDDVRVTVGGTAISKNTRLMAITPDEFGKIAWFRDDLLPYHWYQYLNLLSTDKNAVLLSESFLVKNDISEGDTIYVTWGGQKSIECIVYAFVDYWPGYDVNDVNDDGISRMLIVANFDYITGQTMIEPYEVWAKKADGATSSQVYNSISEVGIKVTSIEDCTQELVSAKNDPLLQGTNGALTLGFIVTMAITVIGFLIYWILSIKKRVLQFGLMRAMGLSKGRLYCIIIAEQVLISLVAVLIGIIIGTATSDLYVPLMQVMFTSNSQIIPFVVKKLRVDYYRVYIFVGVMLAACLAVLGWIMARIKIDQAVKLGEE